MALPGFQAVSPSGSRVLWYLSSARGAGSRKSRLGVYEYSSDGACQKVSHASGAMQTPPNCSGSCEE